MLLLAAFMTVLTLAIGLGASFVITSLDIYDLTAEMPVARWREIHGMLPNDPAVRTRFHDLFVRYSHTNIRGQDWFFIAITAGISTLLGGAVAFVFARRLSRPITAVAGAAVRVAAGEQDVRIKPVALAGEVAELVESFNAMAASLDAYERERSILTAGIAHEMRTPLTVLRGRLHGLIDGVIAMNGAEAATLLRHVDRLSRIVEELRTLAHAEVNALMLDRREVDLAETARLVAADLAPLAADDGVGIVVSGSAPPLSCDPLRISQALTNLIYNAVKHAPSDSQVLISIHQSGAYVMLSVADSGPGFAADDRERLFAPFWRANSPANAAKPGSGLGLSLALKIAQAHGGTIIAANREGTNGAIFTLQLPLGAAD
ncbi:signal transduction histidine-protein kinase BaeS [Sphingomonas mucosissima]|uniref:histidine kinase n=2 Tax=Sphingomonas mucosissima TaxID=370959 RepID=A0A245ZFG4_9SPHN|nr:signal transduction histidine-protein kinase BaeS [Sphingomonas mucosissima]